MSDKLPAKTSMQVKTGAREVIRLDINKRHVVKITKRMLNYGFSDQDVLAAYRVLITAKKQNLPEGPIMDKLEEGIGKSISPANIIAAMDKVRARYEISSTYAGKITDNKRQRKDIAHQIAECMAAGVAADDVDTTTVLLRDKMGKMRRSEVNALSRRTFETMKTMARSGVDSVDATEVVNIAVENGFDAREMYLLGIAFLQRARWVTSTSKLARAYAAAIKKGATFKTEEEPNSIPDQFNSGNPVGMFPGGPMGIPPGMPGGGSMPRGGGGSMPPAGGPPPGR